MIIFSQKPTSHSRLGNSLVWMIRLHNYFKKYDLKAVFPWGVENFSQYLASDSYYLNTSKYAEDLFKESFGSELTAQSLASISRSIEDRYEKENLLKAFEWEKIIYPVVDKNILYLSGKVNLFDQELISAFDEFKLVIIHEPYKLIDQLKSDYESDVSSIAPSKLLYSTQSYFVNQHSEGKKRIGLHVRNGDYKHWQDGKYFYTTEFWLQKARELLEKGSAVWIFSNDLGEVLEKELKTAGAIYFQESFEIDFVRLMLMDEVIAPPSTFSHMAVSIAKDFYSSDIRLTHLDPVD